MSSPIHVYLDLDVINNDSTTDNDPPILQFEEIRNAPFLDNTEEYFCSIIRFSIQTGSSLPLFIPRVKIGQTNPNLTVYNMTLVWKNYISGGLVSTAELTMPVLYVPQNKQTVPRQPLVSQDLTSTYYHLQSYQDFANMINTALASLWNNLSTQVSTGGVYGALTAGTYPFLQFNPDDGKFILNGNAFYFSESITNGVKLELWFNTRLFELMSGIPSFNAGPVGDKNYRILFNNSYGTNVQQIQYTAPDNTTVSYNAIQVFQEISTVAMWNPIASLVFTSSLLPVLSTNISPPKVYNDTSNSLSSSGNNAGIFNILSDFEVPYSATNQYRPSIDYTPATEYRLLDMNSIMNLNKIDMTVYYKTHYGEYIPFRLQPGCSAHLKMLFRKRSFYLGV